MAEDVYGGFGQARLPITDADTGDTNLAFRDIGQTTLLELFAAAMNAELSVQWSRVCTSLPADDPLSGSVLPVQRKEILPITKDTVQQVKECWPLLSVYRIGEAEWEWDTNETRKVTQQWAVTWAIGPVTLAGKAKLQGALPWFLSIIDNVLEQRGHSAYDSGKIQFGGGEDGPFSFARVVSSSVGISSPDDDDGDVPSILGATAVIETIERAIYTTDHLDGALGYDIIVNMGPVGDEIEEYILDETAGT